MTCEMRLQNGERLVFYDDGKAYLFTSYGTYVVKIHAITRNYVVIIAENNKLRMRLYIKRKEFKCWEEVLEK